MAERLEIGIDTFGDVTLDGSGTPLPHAQVLRNVVAEGVAADQAGLDFIGIGDGTTRRQGLDAERHRSMAGGIAAGDDAALQPCRPERPAKDVPQPGADALIDFFVTAPTCPDGLAKLGDRSVFGSAGREDEGIEPFADGAKRLLAETLDLIRPCSFVNGVDGLCADRTEAVIADPGDLGGGIGGAGA